MKTFSKKTREAVLRASNGRCSYQDCLNMATEFHHMLPNLVYYQNLFPLFLQSPFNCMAICNDCHMTKPKVKVKENFAIVYEEFLNDLSKNTR